MANMVTDFMRLTIVPILPSLPNIGKAEYVELFLASTACGINGEENWPGDAAT
jgi:hypothetical protein